MQPQQNNNTKKYILIGLVVLFTVLGVIAFIQSRSSRSNSSSSSKQYRLQSTLLDFSLPTDFESTSSTLESITVSYIGPNAELSTSKIKLTRYLKKDSSNDNSAKLQDLLLDTPDSGKNTALAITESKTKNSLPILTVSQKDQPNQVSKYLIAEKYIWKLELTAKSPEGLKALQQIGESVAQSISEK